MKAKTWEPGNKIVGIAWDTHIHTHTKSSALWKYAEYNYICKPNLILLRVQVLLVT